VVERTGGSWREGKVLAKGERKKKKERRGERDYYKNLQDIDHPIFCKTGREKQ